MDGPIKFPPIFEEGERQVIILALAWLSLDRPGWDDMLARIAEKFHSGQMFERFKELNADCIKSDTPSNQILEEMNRYI